MGEIRQGKDSTMEYAEQIRLTIVAQAYPDMAMEAQEEFAAEALLKGYRSPKVAYQATNANRRTLADAWELVDRAQGCLASVPFLCERFQRCRLVSIIIWV